MLQAESFSLNDCAEALTPGDSDVEVTVMGAKQPRRQEPQWPHGPPPEVGWLLGFQDHVGSMVST